jgi:uncharacterized membrane protein
MGPISPVRFWDPPPRIQEVGMTSTANGLVSLRVLPVIAGLLIAYIGKLWYLDRMVLLFDDMKRQRAEYATWEY